MNFGNILIELENGKVVRRKSYHKDFVIFKQIPATIPLPKISIMQSVPDDMKSLLSNNGCSISYKHQYILYDFSTQGATYHIFSGDDLDAEDWEVVNPVLYNPHE